VAADVAAAEATLAEASRRARLELRAGPRLVPAAGGLDGELGALLALVAAAAAHGSWARLKACRSGTCRWAFYDAARNHSRRWCSMAVCGNRAKARSFRAR
jgi:predicted RNA-binding Zn ribbon-like protein